MQISECIIVILQLQDGPLLSWTHWRDWCYIWCWGVSKLLIGVM